LSLPGSLDKCNMLFSIQYNTIQDNFIDLRRRNSLVVRLRDRYADWKDGGLTGRVEQMTFYTTLKKR